MRIMINTATTHKGGAVQVAWSFLEECKNYPRHEYIVVLGIKLQELIEQESYPSNFTFLSLEQRPAEKLFSLNDQSKPLKQAERKYKPDVVFTTTGPAYWRPNTKHVLGYNLAHYVYQESPYFDKISFKKNFFFKAKGLLLHRFFKQEGDAYVVQTYDVNRRLRKWLKKENVHTVSNTYGAQYDQYSGQQKPDTHFLPKPSGNEFRLLYLTSYHPHKNIEIINELIDYIKPNENIRFVLTLPEEKYQAQLNKKAREYIYNVGPVKPKDCPQLFTECHAVFLPTLLECFSATYAEAMKMELPIITTDLGFAHTVCGSAALYFDPVDAKDAYRKIIQLKEDDGLRNRLLENAKEEMKKFDSAKERAEKYLKLCEDLANSD